MNPTTVTPENIDNRGIEIAERSLRELDHQRAETVSYLEDMRQLTRTHHPPGGGTTGPAAEPATGRSGRKPMTAAARRRASISAKKRWDAQHAAEANANAGNSANTGTPTQPTKRRRKRTTAAKAGTVTATAGGGN